jgi:glucose-6-phosphate isomerase
MVTCVVESNAFNLDNPYTKRLIDDKVFSRIGQRDASLYSFDIETAEFATRFFGWTQLASYPPVDPGQIASFAAQVRSEKLQSVVLIGQGGSTQASMTITRLNEQNSRVSFKTMDSVSPVYVNKILDACDPAHTLYVVSSKSGTTVETTLLSRVVWDYVTNRLGARTPRRFVAITDPDSELAQRAQRQNWRAVFEGSVDVGGRFSALSVFGLLNAALVGIDIIELLEQASAFEETCCQDSTDNPALQLASFLYSNYENGRRIFSLVSPQPGRCFGLWVEQLVAESLGKSGQGILPNIEIDASMLAVPRDDRCAITYAIRPDASFESDISRIDPSIPTMRFHIPQVLDIASHFIMWEYAIAAVARLMEVNPFDQPDVQLTKDKVKTLLFDEDEPIGITKGCVQVPTGHEKGAPTHVDDSAQSFFDDLRPDTLSERSVQVDGMVRDCVLEAELTPACAPEPATIQTLDDALEALFSTLKPGDYFSLNAFLPFYSEPRRVPLEEIRHCVAAHLGVASCLEIGPRYLHSTGQLHKGGSNNGVFLILSSEEPNDIAIPDEDFTLGVLAHAQACGDMAALTEKGRRALRLHLVGNDADTLARVSARVCSVACKVASEHSRSSARKMSH